MRDADATPRRLPGLDALRGLAVSLVLLNHAWPATFGAAGVVGVTIFFALSGWLITGLLLRDVEQHGRVRYGRFAAARALRLYPPMLFMLAGFVVVEGALDHLGDRHLVPESLLAAVTYTMNLPLLPHGSESLYHFWTLATEEQFYLLWPLVLAWAWRRGLLRVAVGLGVLGTLAACTVTMLLVAPDVARVYALPTSWAAALLIGCAGRLGQDTLQQLLPPERGPRRRLLVVLVALLLATSLSGPTGAHPWWYLLGVPSVAAATVVLVSYAGRWPVLPSRLLRPAVALGTISYAAYLWNAAIVRWLHHPQDALGALATIALTLVAATASWWLVERPAGRLRARLLGGRRVSGRGRTPAGPRSGRRRRRAPAAPARTT
ncbi:acyltransferase [Cellulomonas sp. ES6]|uniref:acyltransferase family protein n=1 Tax=Cellulomonas sp. ES6 TaxID=3039384 RepID=UPI0024B82018|nr:acyltransferase [Cellulomonas sp. ES6]WHP17040.1 acyltransferase [Cellulomonas sp. ES6]